MPEEIPPIEPPAVQPQERKMLKIGLNPALVERAREACGGPTRAFRQSLDTAIERHLAEIDEHLDAAGFRADSDGKGRIWPVSLASIDRLDEVAHKHGIARTELIRALLVLAARELPDQQ